MADGDAVSSFLGLCNDHIWCLELRPYDDSDSIECIRGAREGIGGALDSLVFRRRSNAYWTPLVFVVRTEQRIFALLVLLTESPRGITILPKKSADASVKFSDRFHSCKPAKSMHTCGYPRWFMGASAHVSHLGKVMGAPS